MIRQAHKRGIPLDFKVNEEDLSSPSPFNWPKEEKKSEDRYNDDQEYAKSKVRKRGKSFLPLINAHRDDKFIIQKSD